MATIQTLEMFQKTFGSEPVKVDLEQFGKDATFYLKPLKSSDRDNFEASVVGVDGKGRNLLNLRARLVSLAWCDETGKPIGSAKQIGDLRSDLINALFDEVRRLNGMETDEEVEEAGKD
ncbi:hypothetical protein N9937_01130 [bacterium]|nr:hypothetical protein [bacterium]